MRFIIDFLDKIEFLEGEWVFFNKDFSRNISFYYLFGLKFLKLLRRGVKGRKEEGL